MGVSDFSVIAGHSKWLIGGVIDFPPPITATVTSTSEDQGAASSWMSSKNAFIFFVSTVKSKIGT